MYIRRASSPSTVLWAFHTIQPSSFDIHFEIFHFRFFNVYCKPAASSERTNYISQLVKCLSQYYLSDGTNIIVGDMNCGDIDWVNLLAPSDSVQDVFLNFAVRCGYSQLITNPTRGNKILDVLLASEPLSICDVTVMQRPFSNSDHSQVGFKVFVEPLTDSPKAVPRAFRCWEAGNYAEMSRYLSSVNFTADAIWDGCFVTYSGTVL